MRFRQPPIRDDRWLRYVRTLPCCSCQADPPSEAHHHAPYGEQRAGQRTHDIWAVPLCHSCHQLYWHPYKHLPDLSKEQSRALLAEACMRLVAHREAM